MFRTSGGCRVGWGVCVLCVALCASLLLGIGVWVWLSWNGLRSVVTNYFVFETACVILFDPILPWIIGVHCHAEVNNSRSNS